MPFELKPCMCGGIKLIGPIWDQFSIPNREERYSIRCTECNLRRFGKTKESVVEAWNDRPGERVARSAVILRIMNFLGQMEVPQEAEETLATIQGYILKLTGEA